MKENVRENFPISEHFQMFLEWICGVFCLKFDFFLCVKIVFDDVMDIEYLFEKNARIIYITIYRFII